MTSAGLGVTLQDKYTSVSGTAFLTGTQALVRVVIDAMRRDRAGGLATRAFVSGYPGSPLGGLDRELQRNSPLLDELGVVHLPGHNEELAATAVAGSQMVQGFPSAHTDGVLGVWYGKAPGVDRALDALRHGQFTGASSKGGVLVLAGDDPECKSSTLPSASEHTLISAGMPVLYPADVAEILALGAHAVAMSRLSGLWVAMKIVSSVADGFQAVDLDRAYASAPVSVPDGGAALVRTPGVPESMDAERDIATVRSDLARRYGAEAGLVRVEGARSGAWLGVVAAGPLYAEVVEALRQLGIEGRDLSGVGVRLLQARLLHPIDPQALVEFCSDLEEVLVVEEKAPLLEPLLRSVMYGQPSQPVIVGRTDELGRPLVPGYGVVHASDVAPLLRRRLARRIPEEQMRPLPARRERISLLSEPRTPYFCSGCPHNTGTRVPEGALVGGGIGCHAIVRWTDPRRVGDVVTKSQMGGEGATWLGMEPFVGADHIFQNMGDGTYFHSGQLAVQAAIAAGSHITFKLLYNRAIAMTGGQDPAESNSRPVSDVARALLAQGVARVLVTTDEPGRYRRVKMPAGVEVWPRDRIIEAQEQLRSVPGVTVLIHDQECATERRRHRKRGTALPAATRVVINERVCEGCGDCGVKSNCLSLEPVDTEFGTKRQVDQTSCNQDYTCLAGDCPSFVLVSPGPVRTSTGPVRTSTGTLDEHGASDLRDPEPVVDADDFTVRMPGVGGTGVVTVSQILGQAAVLDGRYVRGLDQTGLSQKAGPVVSDVRITSSETTGSNRAGRASADLLLCFDELVAATPDVLDTVVAGHTVAVCSTSPTQTGSMVAKPARQLPSSQDLAVALTGLLGADRVFWADSRGASQERFGSGIYANVLLLAWRSRWEPFPCRPAPSSRPLP